MRFIHVQILAKEFLSIKGRNRRFCLGLIRHFYKTKSPWLAAVLVLNNGYRAHLAEGLKCLTNILLCYLAGQISDINIHNDPPPYGVIQFALSNKKNRKEVVLEFSAGFATPANKGSIQLICFQIIG
jgi:hypothetical protein